MKCGEKYSHLIRSATGRKPDSRCTVYCNESDVEDWQLGARELRRRVSERAAAVVLPADLAAELGNWSAEVDAMAEPAWYPGEWGNLVGRSISLMGDGACLFERIETAAKKAGNPVQPMPTAPGGGGGLADFLPAGAEGLGGNVLLLLGALGVGYVLTRGE